MNKKICILTLLIIFHDQCLIKAQSLFSELNCTIKNRFYSNEFLYSSIQEGTNELKKYESNINTYLFPIEKVSEVSKIKWRLIKSVHKSDTYYIKNVKYDQYLCVDNLLKNMFGIKLIVKTVDYNEHMVSKIKNCHWDVKKVDFNKNDFFILAKNYDQLLTASSAFIGEKSMLKRNLFFWPKSLQLMKKSLMDQQWNFHCY